MRTLEKPIEPELPICDPHHHLWYNTDDDYRLEDFLKDISGGHNIRQTVFVESRLMLREYGSPEMKPVGETEFVHAIVAQELKRLHDVPAIAAGIVGFSDLTLGAAVAPVLEAHISAAGNRFRGIRYTTAWDTSPDFKSRWEIRKQILLDRKFREGFATLRKYNLSFDAWLYHPQLMELVDLATAFPDIPIIVDHVGGPLGIGPYAHKRDSVFQEWKDSISKLASCPNVYIKLGGLGMRICGFGWHNSVRPPSSAELADAMAPYYLWCIEQFGVNRCIFESNFPVDKQSYSYTILWNSFKRITKDFSYQDRRALFHDTAVNVYRLAA